MRRRIPSASVSWRTPRLGGTWACAFLFSSRPWRWVRRPRRPSSEVLPPAFSGKLEDGLARVPPLMLDGNPCRVLGCSSSGGFLSLTSPRRVQASGLVQGACFFRGAWCPVGLSWQSLSTPHCCDGPCDVPSSICDFICLSLLSLFLGLAQSVPVLIIFSTDQLSVVRLSCCFYGPFRFILL